jgi:nicotinamidase-related amidase
VSTPEAAANQDPLRDAYREGITEPANVLAQLHAHQTALLVIDVQYLDAAQGYGVFATAEASGVPAAAQKYYFDSLRDTVLPNIARLQAAFRALNLEVIHTRIQSLTPDGRDRSPGHVRLGVHAAPGSKEAEFLPEVAPVPGEIVINKTASGVFTATNLEYVLRNLGVRALVVAGVYTNECVSTAVRDGSDLGFHMTLVQDACTTVTADLQTATIRTLRDRYARVVRTGDTIRGIQRLASTNP